MNDNELKAFFHQNRPHTSDESTYMAGLSAKMDAVAKIKYLHDASIRKYRIICAVTFAVGCVVGMAVIAFILMKPITVSMFKNDIMAVLFSYALEWKEVMTQAIVVASIVFVLISWKKRLDFSSI